MRFLVDESSSWAVVRFLRDRGDDVVAVAEVMPRADDDAVLAFAAREARILVTSDKDFGELAFRAGMKHAGILLLRPRDARRAGRLTAMSTALEQVGADLAHAFTVVTEESVRIHRVPHS